MAKTYPLNRPKPEPIADSAPYEPPEDLPVVAEWVGPRWEYQLVRTAGNQMDVFNKEGNNGWEAVNSEGGFTLFKRHKV